MIAEVVPMVVPVVMAEFMMDRLIVREITAAETRLMVSKAFVMKRVIVMVEIVIEVMMVGKSAEPAAEKAETPVRIRGEWRVIVTRPGAGIARRGVARRPIGAATQTQGHNQRTVA